MSRAGEHRVIAHRAMIDKTELPKATVGPSAGKRQPKLETVALFPDTMLAGVVTSGDGRIFLSFPRWNPVEFSVAELTKDGTLAPIPNLELHQPEAGEKRLVSIQGIDETFDAKVEGQTLGMRGHTDGIALSPGGRTLYFHALSQRVLFSVSTDALVDENLSNAEVEATIQKIANKTSASDGIGCDAENRVYTTDYEDGAIRRWTPGAGEDQPGEMIIQDERLLWPDAVAIHGGYLYVTTNQMNRLDKKTPPYALFRVPVDAKGIGEK